MSENKMSARFAESTPCAALCNHIAHIVGISAKPEMVGINARGIVATMAYEHAIRNNALMQFIGKAMSELHCVVSRQNAVAAQICSASPKPASIRLLVNALPKAFFGRGLLCSGVMPRDKSHRLTLYVPSGCVGTFGDRGRFTAPTFAKLCHRWVNAFASAVTTDESHGFALDPISLLRAFFGNSGLLTTTTMAITVGNFKRGIMGLHRNLSFLMPNPATC